jgi:hypothetical protein
MADGAPLTGVITTGRSLSAEDAAVIRERFDAKYGVNVAVLSNGWNYIPATLAVRGEWAPGLARLSASASGLWLSVLSLLMSLSALLMSLWILVGR